jgi:hypothetical protein
MDSCSLQSRALADACLPMHAPGFNAEREGATSPDGAEGPEDGAKATQPSSTKNTRPAADRGRGLILLVEDLADTREAFAHILTQDGFRVAAAADGQECVDKAFARCCPTWSSWISGFQ